MENKYNPIFELRPENWYYAAWYIYPGNKQYCEKLGRKTDVDIMAMMWREMGSDEIIFRYRFRYYNSDDPGDSKDVKSVYEGKSPPGADPQELMEKTTISMGLIASYNDARMRFIPIEGDGKKAAEIIEGQDFSHVTIVDKKDGDLQ